ncbi:uncharacterized protein LOC127261155 isoform X2 [Andrographis paniculata]|uniref:uncharacterized protein LOC127261155 isoform X2 n=1 Tax=Andrographis paniculata TaxID=175694 RepID=UPI0021E84567|nr:uncharacterized protein LOC127261155 isoform X2 [Andrographis paniculata]
MKILDWVHRRFSCKVGAADGVSEKGIVGGGSAHYSVTTNGNNNKSGILKNIKDGDDDIIMSSLHLHLLVNETSGGSTSTCCTKQDQDHDQDEDQPSESGFIHMTIRGGSSCPPYVMIEKRPRTTLAHLFNRNDNDNDNDNEEHTLTHTHTTIIKKPKIIQHKSAAAAANNIINCSKPNYNNKHANDPNCPVLKLKLQRLMQRLMWGIRKIHPADTTAMSDSTDSSSFVSKDDSSSRCISTTSAMPI